MYKCKCQLWHCSWRFN